MKDSKKTAVPKLRFPEFLNSLGWKHEPLSTFISALDAGVSVNAGDRPATPAEIGVLKTSCVTNGVFEPSENKVVLEPEEQERVTECVRGGTIIISRMNTPALVGANAYVENDLANVFLRIDFGLLNPFLMQTCGSLHKSWGQIMAGARCQN